MVSDIPAPKSILEEADAHSAKEIFFNSEGLNDWDR